MKNKLFWRCLRENKKSPSGFDISGTVRVIDGIINEVIPGHPQIYTPMIDFTPFIERGIEIDGTVYHEGDRVQDNEDPSDHGTITVQHDGTFTCIYDSDQEGVSLTIAIAEYGAKIIGTIHDKEQS